MQYQELAENVHKARRLIVELPGLTKEQRRAVAADPEYQRIKRGTAALVRMLANDREEVRATGYAVNHDALAHMSYALRAVEDLQKIINRVC